MDFKNIIDSHRSQIKFYQLSCLALISVLGILAVIVPSSLKSGPYIIQETETVSTVIVSEPWKITVARIQGFLRLFLNSRFEWSKENFEQKREILKTIVSDSVFNKLKDSVANYGSIAKFQDARGFYVLEDFRLANQQHVIEAQVSRIIRLSTTGVVTPLRLRLIYEETTISNANPYGLRVKAIEEGETPQVLEGSR